MDKKFSKVEIKCGKEWFLVKTIYVRGLKNEQVNDYQNFFVLFFLPYFELEFTVTGTFKR